MREVLQACGSSRAPRSTQQQRFDGGVSSEPRNLQGAFVECVDVHQRVDEAHEVRREEGAEAASARSSPLVTGQPTALARLLARFGEAHIEARIGNRWSAGREGSRESVTTALIVAVSFSHARTRDFRNAAETGKSKEGRGKVEQQSPAISAPGRTLL